MNKNNQPKFLTEPSDSSLLIEQAHHKRRDTPRCNEKQDDSPKANFVDKSPLCPDKFTKAVAFNSDGKKEDLKDFFILTNSNFINTDCERIGISESSPQLPLKRECNASCVVRQVDAAAERSKRIFDDGKDAYDSIKQHKTTRYKVKRSRTKLDMSRKKPPKTNLNNMNQAENNSQCKGTSTESIAQSHNWTQTDARNSYCRKCSLKSTNMHGPDNQPIESKMATKTTKTQYIPNGENKTKILKSSNAFCTAVNVTPQGTVATYGGDTPLEASRVASSTDISKIKKVHGKHPLHDRNEAIRQEILNLKKTAERSTLQQLSVLNNPSPLKSLVSTGQIYHEIKKANRNGLLRYLLSMLIFAILLFWLISAIFHFDFILDVFRFIGRHLSTLPIFISRRKKELSTAEILVQYVGSFGKLLKSTLTGMS